MLISADDVLHWCLCEMRLQMMEGMLCNVCYSKVGVLVHLSLGWLGFACDHLQTSTLSWSGANAKTLSHCWHSVVSVSDSSYDVLFRGAHTSIVRAQHTLISVDFPAPLGPSTAIRAAMLAFRVTSVSCGFGAPSYWKVTFLHLRTGFSLDLHMFGSLLAGQMKHLQECLRGLQQ